MSDDLQNRQSVLIAIALFATIAVLIAWDLTVDYREGTGSLHIVTESLMFLVALVGIGLLWRQLGTARANLADALVAAEAWRDENRELLSGLGMAIEKQFDRWQLSKAEADIGLFLLKGLSLKEIAAIRATSERTVREQARALYRKAGLSGRSALSAFFLEDLLLSESGNAKGAAEPKDVEQ